MAFVRRKIVVTVQLAAASGTNQPTTFAGTNSDTATITGLRTSVRARNVGAPADGTAQVRVWGLSPTLMNQFSTLGLVFNQVPSNKLTIEAGDEGGQTSIIFAGTIYYAYGDYSAQPEVPFVFECLSGASDSVLLAKPSSFPGTANVADIASGLARAMNLGFENNGVSVQLSNEYLSGSRRQQMEKLASDAGIEWGMIGNMLSIWPRGGNRSTPNVPIISPETGMIQSPAFTQQGVIVKTLFDPQIAFGGLVEIRSSVLSSIASAAAAAGRQFPTRWAVNKLDLDLDALVPKGQWMATVFGYNPGFARAIIPPAS